MRNDGSDDLESRCAAWLRLGGGELLGCREHHLAFDYLGLHGSSPPIQSTWGKLIRLLLAFKGVMPTNDDVRRYQRDECRHY